MWHIPGAFAVRAPDRIGIVAGLVASLAVVGAASYLYKNSTGRYRRSARALILVLFSLAAFEQVNTTAESGISRPSELAILRSLRKPPSSCQAFYVIDSSAQHQPFFIYQTEAMIISQNLRLPTINGYSGYEPRGWKLQTLETVRRTWPPSLHGRRITDLKGSYAPLT